MKISKNGLCIYCNKYGAKDYVVHGRGKFAKINYFHSECYMKDVNKKKEDLKK